MEVANKSIESNLLHNSLAVPDEAKAAKPGTSCGLAYRIRVTMDLGNSSQQQGVTQHLKSLIIIPHFAAISNVADLECIPQHTQGLTGATVP